MAGSPAPAATGGLVDAVVELVHTGPVPLGAYTLAEIAAVDGVISILERQPASEAVAEAVRSLAARNLITTAPGEDDVEVRGDLGIALAFQERSRHAIDTRLTGTQPDQPWRIVLLPQPEGVTLEVMIDALGIHFYWLRLTEDALDRLLDRLPHGKPGPAEADATEVLRASSATALVTSTRWLEDGGQESTDLVLAENDGDLHTFVRDPADPARLVAQRLDDGEVRSLLVQIARQDPAGVTSS
jgi:hypothetical protein